MWSPFLLFRYSHKHKQTTRGGVTFSSTYHDAAQVTNEPFWGVETKDADAMVALQTQLDHGLGSLGDVHVVVLEGPSYPLIVPFHPQGSLEGIFLGDPFKGLTDGHRRDRRRPREGCLRTLV